MCLLCYERDVEHCHRKRIAELICERTGVEVEHLAAPLVLELLASRQAFETSEPRCRAAYGPLTLRPVLRSGLGQTQPSW